MVNVNDFIQFVQTENIPLSEKTKKALDDLQNPHYTVAVVGPFQIGKSTLINRVFLGEEILLKQGDGRCTTAVMTKVVYGPEKRLTVFYRDPAKEPKVYSGEAISPDLIASLTVVDDADENERQEKRLELAQKVKYIQLEYPCESIKQFSFYDTPGINDPNEELIDLTTIQFLQDADLVILVANAARMLDASTKSFLSRSVFRKGHGRVLILASYRPEFETRTPEELDVLKETIQAQLSQIGRGYAPVYNYAYDQTAEGVTLVGTVAIRNTICEYIDKNKRVAREEKIAWYLRNDVIREIERLKAVVLTSNQSEQERAELTKKINNVVLRLNADYDKALQSFRQSFRGVVNWLNGEVEQKLLSEGSDSVLSEFLHRFEGCDSLGEVRSNIEPAVKYIQPKVDYAFAEIGERIKEKIKEILEKSSEFAAEASRNITFSTGWEINTDLGFVGKIPPALIRILQIGAGGILTGNLLGLIAGAFIHKIPGVKRLLPDEWVKIVVLKKLRESFISSIDAAKQDITLQLEQSQSAIENGIKEVFQEIYQVKVAPYEEQLKKSSDNRKTKEEIDCLKERIKSYSEYAERAVL